MSEVPAMVNNARLDVVAANPLARALFATVFADPARPASQPVNHARFTFLDPRAHDFWIDWEGAALVADKGYEGERRTDAPATERTAPRPQDNPIIGDAKQSLTRLISAAKML